MNPTNPSTNTVAENLATIYQENLTVIVRLRSNRQPIQDADSFRERIRSGLAAAEQQAMRRGYSGEDVRVATFAVVAFLDESVLNSGLALFADWPRKPLQEELFGVHIAGEIFSATSTVFWRDRIQPKPKSFWRSTKFACFWVFAGGIPPTAEFKFARSLTPSRRSGAGFAVWIR